MRVGEAAAGQAAGQASGQAAGQAAGQAGRCGTTVRLSSDVRQLPRPVSGLGATAQLSGLQRALPSWVPWSRQGGVTCLPDLSLRPEMDQKKIFVFS